MTDQSNDESLQSQNHEDISPSKGQRGKSSLDDFGEYQEQMNFYKQTSGDTHFHFYGAVSSSQFGNNNTQNNNQNPSTPKIDYKDEIQTSIPIEISSYDDFQTWFFSLQKQKDPLVLQLHVIATALYSHNTWQFVKNIRQSIYREWLSDEPPPTDDDAPNSKHQGFGRNTSSIFDLTLTTCIEADFHNEAGKQPIRALRFKSNVLREHTMKLIGTSVDLEELRPIIDNTLQHITLASDAKLTRLQTPLLTFTRIQSARAIGELARHNFVHYLNTIIRPWALSDKRQPSEMLGWILLTIVLEEESQYVDNVFNLVKHWAGTNNRNFQWTAAHVCRYLGHVDLQSTLNILKKTLRSGPPSVQIETLTTFLFLYMSANNAYQILTTFASWINNSDDNSTSGRNFNKRVIALFLFLIDGQLNDDLKVLAMKEDTLSTAEGEVTNDTNIQQSPAGNSSEKKPNNIRITIWDVVKRQQGSQESVVNSLIILVQAAFEEQDAVLRNGISDVIKMWFKEAETNCAIAEDIENTLYAIALRSTLSKRKLCLITQQRAMGKYVVATNLHRRINC